MIRTWGWLVIVGILGSIGIISVESYLNTLSAAIEKRERIIIQGENVEDREVMKERITILEDVLIMNVDERSEWVVTDLHNQLAECKGGRDG